MVPVYSTVSFLSLLSYRYAIYFEAMRDCYEAFAIASFFFLLCSYTGADLHSQKDHFRAVRPKAWFWPIDWLHKCCCGENGIWRTPRSGLTWFNARSHPKYGYARCADSILDYLVWNITVLFIQGLPVSR